LLDWDAGYDPERTFIGLNDINLIMCKNSENKDFYLLMLEYGRATLESGVTQKEVKEHFEQKYGYKFDTDDKGRQFTRVFWDVFFDQTGTNGRDGNKLFMQMEAYFKLLEYVELTEARKSSISATRFASAAIVISILSMIASIYYSNLQLATPTKINEAQLEIIKQLEFDPAYISAQIQQIHDDQVTFFNLFEKSDIDTLKVEATENNISP